MERFLKRYAIAASAVILTIMLVLGLSVAMRGTDPAAGAGQQGDRVWTASGPNPLVGNFGNDGAGATTWGVAFPADSNAQPVVYYANAAASLATEDLEWWAYDSKVTSYTTTTIAYCGGTTNIVRVSDASMTQVRGGVSYVAVDDGAGTVGFAELQHGANLNNGGNSLMLRTGASNFAMGQTFGIDDKSGVTFPVGSRVYPLFRIGKTIVGANTVTLDNNAGLVAATKGSPLLGVLQSTSRANCGSGVTLGTVTVGYK